MNDKKPGLIRRFFNLINAIAGVLRTLISLLFLVILVVVVTSLLGTNIQPLPEQAALRIAPGGVIVDQKTYTDPLNQLMQQNAASERETLLSDLISAVKQAAEDERINSLVLELDYLQGGGISKLEELGVALQVFKDSGKPIIAIGDNYSQQQYYLASYADEIHLNPMGSVLITGYGSYPSYLSEALNKLKISVNVFRVGDYKDAIEPFIRNSMSEASREHTLEWLNTLWGVYTSRIENLRNLPADAINDYANNLGDKLAQYNGDSATLALETGLVDHLSTRPQMLERLRAKAGADDNNGYLHINFKTYLSHKRRAEVLQGDEEKPKIGLIVAKGNIMDGTQPQGRIGGDSLAALFRQVRKDNQVKAVVLRVDSPGGSAFASDVIRQEVINTQQKGIPVVVSMGSLAASGGYWISANADQVWATPTTITGSIGVFGLIPTFENSLASLGITSDGVGTTTLADIYNLNRPMSEQAKKVVQLNVDSIYDRFLSLVAEGRDSSAEEVHKIAQGRVWSGTKAKELGLVDELGTLEDAIAAAAAMVNLDDYQIKTIRKPLSPHEQLVEQLLQAGVTLPQFGSSDHWASNLFNNGLLAELTPLVETLELANQLNDPRGVQAICLVCAAP